MADSATNEINLRPIFLKLGHQLEEIRVRSLKNILSKLEHNLVCDADLVQEKHLHIRLLEWFNFPSCPLQQQALALILRFSKHQSAAEIYVDIGGVEFLSQLRANADPLLHKLVDGILDNLFHLHHVDEPSHTTQCLYQKHKHAVTNVQSTGLIPSQLLQAADASQGFELQHQQPSETQQVLGKQLSPEPQTTGYFLHTQDGAWSQVHGRDSVPVEDNLNLLLVDENCGLDSASPDNVIFVLINILAATSSCFKFCTFPWVPLTPTDRHVLSSTDNSLKSKDISLVVSACEFLSDVVFQDFPAEVFLQRPFIIKSLLSLLMSPAEETSEVSQHAIQTLRDLTTALEIRIYYYQDPSLYTPKQDFTLPNPSSSSSSSFLSHSLGSSDSRPSVIGHSDTRQGGDGQDGDSSQNSSSADQLGHLIEKTDIEEVQSLQFLQWTTPQYCMSVLEKLLPCLKTPDERFILHGLELIHQVAALLRESISAAALWEDGSLPARELQEKFSDVLEMIGDIMFLHHHNNLSKMTPASEVSQHRVAYMGLAVFMVRLIETLVPPENVLQALPEFTACVLSLLGQDEALSYSYPDIRTLTCDLLQQLDPDNFNLLTHAQTIGQSMQNTCAFLIEYKDMCDESVLDLLNMAEDGLRSLCYHHNLQLVNGCVNLASYVCKKTSPNPLAVQQSIQLLLTVMAYPLEPIRYQAYNDILSIVKEALGVEHVIEPTSTLSHSISFLFEEKILYELACFGCCDVDHKVKETAAMILLYLLQSQLLVPPARWQHLLESLVGVMPTLQGLGEPDTKLSKCILSLITTDSQIETGTLPLLERFRATLRCMFSQHPRIRMEGLGKLAWFLANEENSMRKLPLFSDLDVSNLTNMFIIQTQRSLLDEDTEHSVFTGESVHKVFEIFTSENVEATVRHSAGEQLAIIMQDPALHGTFHKLCGLEKVISMMRNGVQKPEPKSVNVYTTILPCIVKILRSLVQHDHTLRHKWAHDAAMYYLILRSGLLHHRDSAARKEVSELLVFLLFDEVTLSKTWTDQEIEMPATFSLPHLITKRYSLPVHCLTHHLTSPHMVQMPPSPDPLMAGSMAEMLRIVWNVAWHGGIQEALQAKTVATDQLLFNKALKLTTVDHTVLCASHMPSALQKCIHDIDNATGHSMVAKAVLRLSSCLVLSAQHDITEILQQISWQEQMARFITIVPSSSADEELLDGILQLLIFMLKTPYGRSKEMLKWMVGLQQNPKGALLGLLGRTESGGEDSPEDTIRARRQLSRHLLKFVQIFIGKYPYSLVDRTTFDCVCGDLTQNLLTRINRRDKTHFYNLASLESTLLCLMQVTARPGWSLGSVESDSLSVSLQTLQNLSEVISAFHFGRGGMSMSYMGRGVTRCATICLRHLAHEMAMQLHSKDWPRNWLFARQATADSVGESGLHWLIPLWSYRDTEVRAAGVGIAAALTSTEAGRITMATQCQHIPGGIWGTAFSLLLDQMECSMVRQQAALLLVNLTSQPMPNGGVETTATVWQGPIVRNEETQVSLVGLSALLALLHHSQFYQEMMILLSNYYPQPAIHPISVAGGSLQSSPLGSQGTLTTADTITPAGISHMTDMSASTAHLQTPSPTDHLAQLSMRPDTVGQNPNNHHQRGLGSLHRPDNLAGVSGGTHNGSRTTDTQSASGGSNTVTPASLLADRSGSSSTTDMSIRAEYQSVVTPCLVSAICHLISNIVAIAPEDTLLCINRENLHTTLINLLDVGLIEAYITELCNTAYKQQFLITFQDLLYLYTDILQLIQHCCVHDISIKTGILQNTNALKQIVRLLSVSYEDDLDTKAICTGLWRAVFNLLCEFLQSDGQKALVKLTPVVVKYWSTLAGRIINILQDERHTETDLWVYAQTFLALLLCEEGKLLKEQGGQINPDTYYVLDRLDYQLNADGNDLFNRSSGSMLCQTLVKAYDIVCRRSLEQHYIVKMAVMNALKMLLHASTTAKAAALEAGLVETICDQLKHIHMKLNMDALEIGKASTGRKKDNPLVAELMLNLDLLRNFMFDNSEVKLSAYECGLSCLVHGIWAWCQMESSLMDSTLALLCTFTATCTQAASSLAFTSPSQTLERPILRNQHSNNSLVHALIKLVQRETTSIPVLKAGYAVLANLALSSECRGILWKCNFLHDFAVFLPNKNKRNKNSRVVESLWMDLLVNLSFCTEGQNMILKIEDSISLLLEFGMDSSEHNQVCATLILRNLCFHAANKPKLLANDKLVPFFLQSLEVSSGHVKMVAASALLALAYNNQKAKGVLKSKHVMRKLQDNCNLLDNIDEHEKEATWVEKCTRDLQNVLILLRG